MVDCASEHWESKLQSKLKQKCLRNIMYKRGYKHVYVHTIGQENFVVKIISQSRPKSNNVKIIDICPPGGVCLHVQPPRGANVRPTATASDPLLSQYLAVD